MNQIQDHYPDLGTSPIANISLASKELFHSNFLAWVFNTYPEMVSRALEPSGVTLSSSDTSITTSREERNLDLVIRIGDRKIIVIENKIKSIPNPVQLRNYENTATKLLKNQAKHEFILLTLSSKDQIDPSGENKNWKQLDYNRLSKILRKEIPGRATAYHRSVIEDYCGLISVLSDLADNEAKQKWNPVFERDQAVLPDLKDIRLHDLFGKRQGQQVALGVYQALKKRNQLGERLHWQQPPKKLHPSEVTIYSGFSNSRPLIGVFCAMKNLKCPDDKTPVGVGFQVQGPQFRSYIEWPIVGTLSQKPIGNKHENKAQAIAWALFNDAKCPKSFWEPKMKSGGTKDQCRFGANFHYRYKSSDSADSETLENLSMRITDRTFALLDDLPTIEKLIARYYDMQH